MVYHTAFTKVFIVLYLFNLTLSLLTKDPATERIQLQKGTWDLETIRKVHLHQIKMIISVFKIY